MLQLFDVNISKVQLFNASTHHLFNLAFKCFRASMWSNLPVLQLSSQCVNSSLFYFIYWESKKKLKALCEYVG